MEIDYIIRYIDRDIPVHIPEDYYMDLKSEGISEDDIPYVYMEQLKQEEEWEFEEYIKKMEQERETSELPNIDFTIKKENYDKRG